LQPVVNEVLTAVEGGLNGRGFIDSTLASVEGELGQAAGGSEAPSLTGRGVLGLGLLDGLTGDVGEGAL
jgi:hypothetical protein